MPQLLLALRNFNFFQPVNESSLIVKQFSSSNISSTKKGVQNFHDKVISGYVTVLYDKEWWLGYIVDKDKTIKEATVTFLQP